MNRGELRAFTRRLLSESIASDSFWTDADLNLNLDLGADQVASDTELLQGTITTPSVVDQGEYPLPVDTLRPKRVFYEATAGKPKSAKLEFWPLAKLDAEKPGWEGAVSGTPGIWTQRGRLLVLFSAPDVVNRLITIWDVQGAPPMTADGDDPPFPRPFHPAIAYQAAIFALLQDKENPLWASAAKTIGQMYAHLIATAISTAGPAKHPTRFIDVRDGYPSEWRP